MQKLGFEAFAHLLCVQRSKRVGELHRATPRMEGSMPAQVSAYIQVCHMARSMSLGSPMARLLWLLLLSPVRAHNQTEAWPADRAYRVLPAHVEVLRCLRWPQAISAFRDSGWLLSRQLLAPSEVKDVAETLETLLSEHGRRAFGDEGEKAGSCSIRASVLTGAASMCVLGGAS